MSKIGSWDFENIPEKFDIHINKSVPFYTQIQRLIADIGVFFIEADSIVYDIGCSTGETILNLKKNINKEFEIIGIDNSKNMIIEAQEKTKQLKDVKLIESNIADYVFEKNISFAVSNLTLQFLKPGDRAEVLSNLWWNMNRFSALIVIEKIDSKYSSHHDIYTQLYMDFKEDGGLSPREILDKTKSLRGILKPLSNEANKDMLRNAGFEVDEFFRYLNFVGYLCIKK